MTSDNSQAEKVRNLSRRVTVRQQAVALAEQHGVSLRTAQRWINAGVYPAERRKVFGKDGKLYHILRKPYTPKNQVRCALRSITRALDALDAAAYEHGITSEDAERLGEIEGRVFDTAHAWRTALDGSTEKGGKA